MELQVIEPRNPEFIDEWIREYYESPPKLTCQRLGYGRKPALLVIDFQRDLRLEGLVARAVRNTRLLLAKAREKELPIFFTVIGFRRDLKDFIPNKLSSLRGHILGTEGVEVLDELKPYEGERVLIKKANSAFLGTDLLMSLTRLGVDTLIIAGCHTSGCIRATATDSYSLGFRTIIPEECVGDGKGLSPHKANLCDLHIRGADVVPLLEVLEYLEGLREGSGGGHWGPG